MKRNGLLDFYKFVFAEAIVSHHAIWLPGRNDAFVPLRGGYSAVEFFFIVSGFYLAQNASHGKFEIESIGLETWQIIYKRIIKLFPYFGLSYALSFLLHSIFSGGGDRSVIQVIW